MKPLRICFCSSRIVCMTSGFIREAASATIPLDPAWASYAFKTASIVCKRSSGVLQQIALPLRVMLRHSQACSKHSTCILPIQEYKQGGGLLHQSCNSRGEEILLCSRLSFGRFKGVIQGSSALLGGLDPQQLLQYAHLWGLLLLQRFFGLQKEGDPEAEPTAELGMTFEEFRLTAWQMSLMAVPML